MSGCFCRRAAPSGKYGGLQTTSSARSASCRRKPFAREVEPEHLAGNAGAREVLARELDERCLAFDERDALGRSHPMEREPDAADSGPEVDGESYCPRFGREGREDQGVHVDAVALGRLEQSQLSVQEGIVGDRPAHGSGAYTRGPGW